MPVRKDDDSTKLSRLEVLGAWLGVWTPPRGAVVPPVPWPKVAAGAALLAVVAGLIAVLVVPAIDEAKDERSATEARALGERREARRARQRAEQEPRRGRFEAGGSRAAALTAVERDIGADARRRFTPKARPATCELMAGADPEAARVAYDCVSTFASVSGAGAQEGARGALGVPYRAVLDFARGRSVFCKVNPIPGEQVAPDPREIVQLPAPCRPPGRR
jgi:hypothetical protein